MDFNVCSSIQSDDGKFEICALITDKGYVMPWLKISGVESWDNDEYLLNELWPYLKQSELYAKEIWERLDSQGEDFRKTISDDDIPLLLEMLNKAVALGFFRKTTKNEKTHSRYRF